MGAELKENHPVSEAVFDKGTSLWQIKIEDNELSYRSRVSNLRCSFRQVTSTLSLTF